ncbi:serine proteinase stubble [Sitodiplosis mosellana]|uniref:serine proteinase stubble n=1 Tax=Sitodiplosis mosellana TaxID=263140 RepID=UPI0024452798|nr:serine proteinase stubble [Sitodiplosis mosellana]
MWSRWLISSLQMLLLCELVNLMPNSNRTLKINPKPCTANGYGGTCMWVWECIKSDGQHIGMCVDSFMFGSCCAHNLTENIVLTQQQQHIDFKPPLRKPKPPTTTNTSNRPMLGGTTTIIHRPHGDSMLIIRPSVNKNRPLQTADKYFTKKPTVAQTTNLWINSHNLTNVITDLDAASSSSTGLWNQDAHTTQWQVTTQPNFVTKPKPTEKLPSRPKPKPTKKPIVSALPHIVKRPTLASTTTTTMKTTAVSNLFSQSTKPKPTENIDFSKPTITSTWLTTRKPPQPSFTPTVSPQKITTTPASTFKTTTTSVQLIISTQQHSLTEEENTIFSEASQHDSNDILDENVDKPKRYTISAAKSADCGISTIGRPETRIVGGKNAPFGRWPWQVSVRRTSFFGFSSTHRCGGAIINENWIATAGHCVDDLLTSQIRIRVGEYDFSHVQEEFPYVERAVARKMVHPKYNFFTYEFDLALVQLDSSLEFAPHIAPICLPGTDDLLIGRNATVTGWGRLSEGGTLPSVLQEVQVPIVSNDRCKMMFLRAGRHEFIPDIFLCAGHDTGGHDSCQGDYRFIFSHIVLI